MIALSSACMAIAIADKAGALRTEAREGRFGGFVAICDNHGIIEVADNMAEAMARIAAIRERMALSCLL